MSLDAERTEMRKCRYETICEIHKLVYREVLEIRYVLRLLVHLPEILFIKHIIVHIIACVGHAWFMNPPEETLSR